MPPSKRRRNSHDPLDSPQPPTIITIKQESANDTSNNPIIESYYQHHSVKGEPDLDYEEFDDDYDDDDPEEDNDELLEEIVQEQKPKGKRKRNKYLKYKREDLVRAADLVCAGKISIFKSAKLFGIPKTSLHYFVKNRMDNKPTKQQQEKKERKPMKPKKEMLAEAEEEEVLEWLKAASDLGVDRVREDLLQAAADVLRLNKKPGFKNDLPSPTWFKKFVTRHSSTAKLRRSTDDIDERKFFTKFRNFLAANNLLDVLERPDAFYVMEDSNFELNTRTNNSKTRSLLRRALGRRGGDPNDYRRRDSVTVTYCFGADGRKLQELVIFNENFKDIVKVALVDQGESCAWCGTERLINKSR
jgi:hypothetical protein